MRFTDKSYHIPIELLEINKNLKGSRDHIKSKETSGNLTI